MSVVIERVLLQGTNYGRGTVQVARYQEGGPALRIVDDTGEVITTITVNLPDTPPAEGAFWVKTWAENHGMLVLLGFAGLVEYTGEVAHPSQWVEAIEAKPKGALKELIERMEVGSWRS